MLNRSPSLSSSLSSSRRRERTDLDCSLQHQHEHQEQEQEQQQEQHFDEGGENDHESSKNNCCLCCSGDNTSASSSSSSSAPCYLRWLELPFKVKTLSTKETSPDASGWAMDSAARGPLNAVGTFVGSAIVRLALQEAGCSSSSNGGDDDVQTTCDQQRLYGLKPSSMLTVVTSIVGVLAALMLPVVGAVVDRTKYRKLVGTSTAFLVVAITAVQAFINQENWFIMLILEGVSGFLLIIHITAVFAYLPDLSTEEKDLIHFNTAFNTRQYVSQFLQTALVVAAGLLASNAGKYQENEDTNNNGGDDDDDETRKVELAVYTARIAAAVAASVSGVLLAYAWFFLFSSPKPRLRAVVCGSVKEIPFKQVKRSTEIISFVEEENTTGDEEDHQAQGGGGGGREPLQPLNLLTIGFEQVYHTTRTIVKSYHGLKWFMIALLWSPEAGTGVTLSIATTYITAYVGLDGIEVAIVSFLILILNIPGSFLGKCFSQCWNPLNSFRFGLLFFAVVIALTGATTGPEKVTLIYGWACLWGLAIGWIYPVQRVLFCTLIPKNGQEMEYMGMFAFVGNVLSWLPTLIFTTMNENITDMRWGLSVLSWFLFIAFLCALMVGDYEGALEQVAGRKVEEEKEDDDENFSPYLQDATVASTQKSSLPPSRRHDWLDEDDGRCNGALYVDNREKNITPRVIASLQPLHRSNHSRSSSIEDSFGGSGRY